MSIEQDLRDVSVEHTSRDHQRQLRGALLAHLQEVQTMKSSNRTYLKRLLPAGLTIVLALVIITGAMFIPRNSTKAPGTQQGTIAKLTGALTPSQVLAYAAEQADQYKIASGKYFYQKARVNNSVFYCLKNYEFSETWTDSNGDAVQYKRTNTKGKTIELHNSFDSTKDFFDQTAIENTMTHSQTEMPTLQEAAQMEAERNSCPSREPLTAEQQAKWSAHYKALANLYGFNGNSEKPVEAGGNLFLSDLRQGNPELQASTLRKLQSVNDWAVFSDVTNKDFSDKKLVKLSFTYGWAYQNLYFDQQTAAFVGYESDEPFAAYNSYVVIDQKPVSSLDQ